MPLSSEKIILLKEKAALIRKSVVEMLIEARSGHLAGSLGMADVFTYLYFQALLHYPRNPSWEYRDRLVLSNGHICPVLYASMAHSGYFEPSELLTLRKLGSRLQGHPHREYLSMLETSSGPLGSGLSQAVGMALAGRLDSGSSSGRHFYCLMSDGELDEGNSWEAVMLAAKEKLNNLTVVVDRNCIQISGPTEEIMPLDKLSNKFEAFNWNVIEANGHDFESIDGAFQEAKKRGDRPSIILMKTIPSKGIPEFEGKYEWHGKAPVTEEEVRVARRAVGIA
ncbi:MAG: transketolase [Candidatus Paceibacterota bacterium]